MIALDNGDKIRGDASVLNVVDYTLNGSVGVTITQLADGQLAAAIGDLYTAGAADIAVHSITLVNTDSAARTVNLYLTPSGGTARRLIPKDLSLGAGFSLVFDGQKIQVMDTSGNILTSINLASPTFSGTVTISSLTASEIVATNASKQLVSLAVATYPSLAELAYVKGVTSALQTQLNLKAPLASPTFTGTVTTAAIAIQGYSISAIAYLYGRQPAEMGVASQTNVGGSGLGLYTRNAADSADVRRVAFQCLVDTAEVEWFVSTHKGFKLSASEKINPASGVAGYSVVSTALTLGSLGSVVIPQSAANVTDALAGNIAGAIALDLTGAAERLYFRGSASWFYIAKTGGLSMTREERLDPSGHKFEVGDMVRLIVDKVNPDGSFHAMPHYMKN